MERLIILSESGMVATEPIQIPELADVMCAALTGTVLQVLAGDTIPPELKPQLEKELFDSLNISFSKCLDNAFPTLAGRPELSEEAILELENQMITAAANRKEVPAEEQIKP